MADFFIYNNDGIIPDYIPGIPGYGQRGSRGNTGFPGASVYYSSFDLSNPKEQKLANDCIKNNKVLSNNLDDANANEYREHDIIIDTTGALYILVKDEKSDELKISGYQTSNNSTSVYSSPAEHFTGFNIFCSTSFLKSSSYSWKRKNPKGSETLLEKTSEKNGKYMYTKTPNKVRYRNKIEDTVYGNYVTFKLTHDNTIQDSDYIYTFVLCFPNGQCFKTISKSSACTMFIENRYIYGCFDVKSWNDPMTQFETPLYGVANLNDDNVLDGTKLIDCIEFNGVNLKYSKEAFNENPSQNKDASMNKEYSKETTILCSEFIKHNCTGYAELYSKETGVTYRIDMDDIFIKNSPDGSTSTSSMTNIESIKDNLIWSVYNYPSRAWVSDTDIKYDMDAYVPFVVDSTETEDEHRVDCFFVTNRNPEDAKHRGALESYINPEFNEFHDFNGWDSWVWKDSSSGNRVIRLYFRNLDSFSISIKYNDNAVSVGSDGTIKEEYYPTTMVYVGAPDCNLIQYGNNTGINDKIQADSITGITGILNKCDKPGIYYMNKFIAPGIELKEPDKNVMEAGLTDYTIHPKEYNLDTAEYHYIEIGLVSFKDKDDIESHLNVPKSDNVDASKVLPKYRMFENKDNYQSEMPPFSAADIDYNGDLISGIPDLSISLYAVADAVDSSEDTADIEPIPYDPMNYVHKDTL